MTLEITLSRILPECWIQFHSSTASLLLLSWKLNYAVDTVSFSAFIHAGYIPSPLLSLPLISSGGVTGGRSLIQNPGILSPSRLIFEL